MYMIYLLVLALHLGAAALTGVAIVYALQALVCNKSQSYRTAALSLGFIAAFEVLSGTVLAIVSPDLSASALSAHIVEYLGVCLVVESLIFVQMKKISFAFPLQLTLSPVLASCLLFVATLSLGF